MYLTIARYRLPINKLLSHPIVQGLRDIGDSGSISSCWLVDKVGD